MQNLLTVIILIWAVNICSCSGQNNKPQPAENDKQEQSPINNYQPIVAYYNDEHTDTTKIISILRNVKDIVDPNERIITIAKEFLGTPYVGGTLNVPPQEQLYVNTTNLDCLTFVETVIALTKTTQTVEPTVNDYLINLKSIRYRNGEINGYPSRLHYISEWGIDNEKRGNFREITPECEFSVSKMKTIDYMTKNRNLYPALANDSVFKAIQENEKPLQNLRYSIIPASKVDEASKSFLKSGDIVAIETNKSGLDVSHVGILNIRNGIPYMIHASSKYKKVINDTLPLKKYLEKQKSPGIRVFRL